MKAQTSHGIVSIRWQYGECEKQVMKSGGEQTVKQQCTSCFITGADGNVIANATVKRYITDPESKVIARKESFKKTVSTFSKADKTAMWDVYAANVKLS